MEQAKICRALNYKKINLYMRHLCESERQVERIYHINVSRQGQSDVVIY